jgi:hypothetical protein
MLYFVPTSSNSRNRVERWFAELDKAIPRGIVRSVKDLQVDIPQAWNEVPSPFVWTASVESITQKLSRCRRIPEQIQPGCTSPRTRKKEEIAVQLFRGHYTNCCRNSPLLVFGDNSETGDGEVSAADSF